MLRITLQADPLVQTYFQSIDQFDNHLDLRVLDAVSLQFDECVVGVSVFPC